MRKKVIMYNLIAAVLLAFVVTGCAVNLYSGRPSDKAKIGALSSEVEKLQKLREKERQELQEAMELLEKRLKQEIGDKEVRLEMAERGLVITFVAEVLFDSGKAVIRKEAYPILDKVATVIRDKVYDREIGIEGHTDNEPIRYSGWKSNWELSTARATSVLHYLVDNGKLNPKKLSAIGYGEYRPIASNDTAEGKQKNRRVEIVIIPRVAKEREVGNKGIIETQKPIRYEKVK
ncbi:MAG: OmpA family protein [Candidatus Omnitrophica bacterium]|nr:OmpA family protein [Candidatus Omnitrophota bacterium]